MSRIYGSQTEASRLKRCLKTRLGLDSGAFARHWWSYKVQRSADCKLVLKSLKPFLVVMARRLEGVEKLREVDGKMGAVRDEWNCCALCSKGSKNRSYSVSSDIRVP